MATVVAQCPVSARAAMEARRRLGQNFSVAMVCHFNYSEATEYREKGELSSERFFQRMLAMEKKVLESVDRVIYVSNWARDIVEREARDHAKGLFGHLERRFDARETFEAISGSPWPWPG